MRSTVEQLSWVERLYPSNMAKGVAGSLDSLSDWLKTAKKSQALVQNAQDTNDTPAYSTNKRLQQMKGYKYSTILLCRDPGQAVMWAESS